MVDKINQIKFKRRGGKMFSPIGGHGVTTDSYDDNTQSIGTSKRNFKSISIKNTHASAGLKFKFIGYFSKAEKSEDAKLKSETTLAHGDIYNLILGERGYDHIKLFVKNAVPATRCTWLYEAFLQ